MLNATSTQNDNKLYSYAALFIYGNNQDVTKDKIVAVLKALGVSAQMKLAELFECDVIQMKTMLSSTSSTSSAPVASNKTDEKEEEVTKPAEEEPAEEIELDFGDLF
ncbi:60s ribosomal protein p1 [Vairimorpha ceranae]|uniref:60s ribosomal protein p1 n=1 Tax=Vairimorpha ceranae TaxID=40302 RepID=A0A0F9WHG4_9MICR|nr:60s ribosomal protein p1 [Vairimorpha ceranae]KKO76065.1 60s ribosomal protein p1 [Vairimorpha ceranae]